MIQASNCIQIQQVVFILSAAWALQGGGITSSWETRVEGDCN